MAIGFNTPSKRQAETQEKTLPNVNMEMGVNVERLKNETIGRLSQLGSLITSEVFTQYSPEQKAQILMDFAYYSKVADTL